MKDLILMKAFKLLKNEQGLTLVELLGSIVILSIIVMSFLGFFIQSAKTTQVSDEILDGSYVAQQQAEEIYNFSHSMNYEDLISYFDGSDSYNKDGNAYVTHREGYAVRLYIEPTDNDGLYSLLIKVFDSDGKQSAQVETKFFFDEVGE